MRIHGVAMFLLLSFSGCKDDSPAAPKSVKCKRSAEAYCQDTKCKTFEEERAAFADHDQKHEYFGGGCLKMEYGRCGPFRYVDWSNGYSNHTVYYDAAGKVAWARVGGDTPPTCEDGARELTWGETPGCTREVEKDYCARDR